MKDPWSWSVAENCSKSAWNRASHGRTWKTWIDGEYFWCEADFSDVMSQITGFNLFGSDMVNLFASQTAAAFRQFQQSLTQLNRSY